MIATGKTVGRGVISHQELKQKTVASPASMPMDTAILQSSLRIDTVKELKQEECRRMADFHADRRAMIATMPEVTSIIAAGSDGFEVWVERSKNGKGIVAFCVVRVEGTIETGNRRVLARDVKKGLRCLLNRASRIMIEREWPNRCDDVCLDETGGTMFSFICHRAVRVIGIAEKSIQGEILV
jgi:hypothetical protein